MFNADVLIVGSGAAGLSAALRLADTALVALFAKEALPEGSTRYAQGGIAAVFSDDDSIDEHVKDTLIAGDGLCNEAVVRQVASCGKVCIDWLIELGVDFTHCLDEQGKRVLHLHQEGGHSKRRIIHAKDATGHSLTKTLVERVREHPNITIYEYHIVVDLVCHGGRVVGAYVYDQKYNVVHAFAAKAVLLASGGASRVYLYSTNPDVSSGDGIAIAYRAGARVANMEFNQFHPTCLFHPKAGSFLLSEAMRGEGARLVLPDGTAFMQRFDARGELAPRDIVARAIDHEMKRLGIECVYLDITHRGREFIVEHFPMIYEKCLHFGIDITQDKIPVVPAAHYTCGGVMVDINARTNIKGLYAAGEVSHTGLHGANRMASNSLLECLVFAESASKDILRQLPQIDGFPAIKPWDDSYIQDAAEEVFVTYNWEEVRRLMWHYVGIVRSDKRLQRARRRIELLAAEIQAYYRHFRVSRDVLELRNLTLVAELIIRSAMMRKESRGLHYTLDYPKKAEKGQGLTVLTRPLVGAESVESL